MNFRKENLSPIAIAEDLQQAVAMLPDNEQWVDYFEGGVGRTIIELIAGSQAIKNHYNLMRVRESSLQVARLDSSVTELAINKGVYRPPAKAMRIKITYNALNSGKIRTGEKVGSYKNYDVLALQNLDYKYGNGNELMVTVGSGEKYERDVFVDDEFVSFDVTAKHKYVADEFQTLSVNDHLTHLIDEEMNLYEEKLKNTCIRLVYENTSRLVFGDGIIGKKLKANDTIIYSYMSFGDDLLDNFKDGAINLNQLPDVFEIEHINLVRKATPYLSKEKLRKVAMRNSVDGRWVQVEDYKNGIMRQFGEYLDDVLVKDEYPEEIITILPKKGTFTDVIKTDIRTLVDNKRGNATLVNINYLDPLDNNRLSVVINLIYTGPESSIQVQKIIDEYVVSKLNQIHYASFWLVGADVAVDLTALSDGKFYCDLDDKIHVGSLQSVKELTILFTR